METDDFHALKARITLSEYIMRRVKLTRNGPDWFGCCPFHQEKSASFSVNDAKGFFHCFGCHAHGDILDWWQKIEGLTFHEARERLRLQAGETSAPARRHVEARPSVDEETARKQRDARSIWREAADINGTIAEVYLRSARCIALETLPECLRFHPGLLPDPRHEQTCPAMISAVTDNVGGVVAVQRTFLKPDGSGKAGFSAPKRSLGPVGQGAVRLAAAGVILGIAEGVETGLSAMELFRVPVWCVLGSNLSRIELPSSVRQVVIFGDKGKAGEEAAAKARQTFRSRGRKVAVRFSEVGDDFNDELRARHHGS